MFGTPTHAPLRDTWWNRPAASFDSIIRASRYAPGFYGNTTACGQVYTPEILGVAHLTCTLRMQVLR